MHQTFPAALELFLPPPCRGDGDVQQHVHRPTCGHKIAAAKSWIWGWAGGYVYRQFSSKSHKQSQVDLCRGKSEPRSGKEALEN